MFSVGNAYKGQLVDAFIDDAVIQVWHQNHLIKTVARLRKGRCARSEPMDYTSTIRRSQNGNDQPELDRGHTLRSPGQVLVHSRTHVRSRAHGLRVFCPFSARRESGVCIALERLSSADVPNLIRGPWRYAVTGKQIERARHLANGLSSTNRLAIAIVWPR
jgi:hypothetical protein